ncbi:chorismate mutase [Streptomyces sp. KA12]|uniref:chorismate mutase n=1 Tax=Streptomyces sp. KA12 TaxID=2991730 RepID=UPI0023B02D9F|nr:chorismate mutase [Streptomyces sp. KA12]MDF0374375.1 chorismate mutase [Streptomyces sp. KA12]
MVHQPSPSGHHRGRELIDDVDARLIRLIGKRRTVSEEIGNDRLAAGGTRTDTAREMDVISRFHEAFGPPGRDIALSLLRLSRGEPPPVGRSSAPDAFLGPADSYSGVAHRQFAGSGGPVLLLDSATDVLDAVRRGRAGSGTVAVHNTGAGPVAEVMDALALGAPLSITGERRVPVALVLATVRPGPPVTVRTVHTHPHAYAQCASWFAAHLPGVRCAAAPSTAAGAETVAREGDASRAALCAPGTAERLGLHPLAGELTGTPPAVTRFLRVVRAAPPVPPTGRDLTTLVAPADRVPLLTVVRSLTASGVHVQDLYPGGRHPDGYLWIDVAGHRDQAPLAEAIDRLRRESDRIRVLGSYPRASVHAVSGEIL